MQSIAAGAQEAEAKGGDAVLEALLQARVVFVPHRMRLRVSIRLQEDIRFFF